MGEVDLRYGLAHLNAQNELTKERLADLPLVGEIPGRAEGVSHRL
jgi:hypothetical protein